MSLDQSGSNTATNDSAADWMRQYRVQKRLCEEANGVLRSLIKRAKSDGINTKAMIEAVKASKLDPEVVAADLRDQIRYMGIIHVPMTQASLFDDYNVEVSTQTAHADDLWDADDNGYRAGRHGARIEDCPYDPGTELHVHWLQAWHKGQAAIARELGPDVKPASASKTRKRSAQPRLAVSNEAAYVPASAKRSTRRRKAEGGASTSV
jgi:ribosome modulation factor